MYGLLSEYHKNTSHRTVCDRQFFFLQILCTLRYFLESANIPDYVDYIFMRSWHRDQLDASEQRQTARGRRRTGTPAKRESGRSAAMHQTEVEK